MFSSRRSAVSGSGVRWTRLQHCTCIPTRYETSQLISENKKEIYNNRVDSSQPGVGRGADVNRLSGHGDDC